MFRNVDRFYDKKIGLISFITTGKNIFKPILDNFIFSVNANYIYKF